MIRYNLPRSAREDEQIDQLLDGGANSVRYDCQGNAIPIRENENADNRRPNRRSPGCGMPPFPQNKNDADHPSGGCCRGDLASACGGVPSLAMVYSPRQSFRDIYSPLEALRQGTLFKELDKPWKGGGRKC